MTADPSTALPESPRRVLSETAGDNVRGVPLLNTEVNETVVWRITTHSRTPLAAVRLWASLLPAIDLGTGEIMLSRAELAARLSIPPRQVSAIIRELEGMSAVHTHHDGHRERYYINRKVVACRTREPEIAPLTLPRLATDNRICTADGARPSRIRQ